jgi:hypothetical protein
MTARSAKVLIGHSLVDDIDRGIVDGHVAHQHLLERVGPDAVEPVFVENQSRPGIVNRTDFHAEPIDAGHAGQLVGHGRPALEAAAHVVIVQQETADDPGPTCWSIGGAM